MPRHDWTRPQLLAALSLYCQIPFGRIHHRNPAIIALAAQISRTPSAVTFKLVNFASLDPEHHRRGVRGMSNVSEADRQIWAEFYQRWDALAEHSPLTTEAGEPATLPPTSNRRRKPPTAPPSGPTEILRTAKARRGQAFFRAAVLAAHDYKCCITGITGDELVRASHIVPWAADATLRLDPRNGLCLNALHDAAFDCGLITLTDQFELRLSKRLRSEVPATVYSEMFDRRAGTPITMPERFRPAPEMLAYHRSKVFCA